MAAYLNGVGLFHWKC